MLVNVVCKRAEEMLGYSLPNNGYGSGLRPAKEDVESLALWMLAKLVADREQADIDRSLREPSPSYIVVTQESYDRIMQEARDAKSEEGKK